ncbi:MAG TPA: CvpA family protein [Verrucomicrobiae bacterium]|jgi:hypothetical protein|nr:CvpA family protein [Verrucomicrobiae bacterium]
MLESVFQFFDKITQNVALKVVLDHVQWVDWFAALFIILGIIYGLQNGFIAEIAEIAQIMIVIFVVLGHYDKLADFVLHHSQGVFPPEYVPGVCFIVAILMVWVPLAFLYKYLSKFFHTQMPAPVKLAGGALLGGVHLLMIFSLFCQAILLLPFPHLKKPLTPAGTSYSGKYVAELAPKIHDMIYKPVEAMKEDK